MLQATSFLPGHLGPLSSDHQQQPNITSDALSSTIFLDPSPHLGDANDFNNFLLSTQLLGIAPFQYGTNASGLDWPQTEQPLPECMIPPPRETDETEEKVEKSSQNSGKQQPTRKTIDSQQCPEGCGFSAKTRRDVDRHYQSVHKKKMSFYCQSPGCPRGLKGWYRKDLRDRHVLLRHNKSGKRRSQSTPKPDSSSAFSNEHKENLSPSEYEDDSCEDSEESSVSELLKMLRKERDRYAKLEGELETLRSMYDKREDKWLSILTKGTWGDGGSQAIG